MKKIHIISTIATLLMLAGCSDFLNRESESILSNEQVFSDQNMITSVLANYYGRIDWGQSLERGGDYCILDEATHSSGGPDRAQDYWDDIWRVYDYGLIRNINQFLQGINSPSAANLSDAYKKQIEGEVRFIRAWTYFNMCRCMGGMPIVNDEVFEYSGGMDITALQYPRSTEAELYDYIISECTAIAQLLPEGRTVNAARVNKWAALMLKARAAVYAGSIAKYNYLTPEVKTAGGEVGIPADKANGYFQIAYDASREIIAGGVYNLYKNNPNKGANFYEAICNKSSNEVIWARDYYYPGNTTGFTNGNIASSVRGDIDANIMTPTLNIVEAFEYINDRDGSLRTRTADDKDYIYYDKPEDLFKDKDSRLYGTIVYPGSDFNGIPMTYQAGQKYFENGEWKERTGNINSFDEDGDILTSENGPNKSDDQYINNSGFNLRKFIDYNKDASTRGRGSDMWFVRMRYAEALMIASEASLELGKDQTEICSYINQIRERAGIQLLTHVTLADIEKERLVEFAFENHRWWDLRRWRRAHLVYDGMADTYSSVHYALFPFIIKDTTHPQNGKWVFDKLRSTWTAVYPHRFQFRHYYNFINQDWINRNPKMVKNPYQ
ncbi:MAG: RagB/SusD family nutrient uptake outer membrane protein [Dysgonamonadaceae bacterium]|jgi:hypothetical protein|nr:RagB/SusD family nutrient uptake outer membrane protein [Dysgonamonadaceae bacterium]